jgi:hypothetical protein
MSTIKISQLATTNIALSDFIIKADAEGVATKNTVQGLADLITATGDVSFKGPIAIADTPSENGWYFASESGTYTNCGGLVIDTAGNIAIIVISGTFNTFNKIDIPVNITIDSALAPASNNAISSGGVYRTSVEGKWSAVTEFTEASKNLYNEGLNTLNGYYNGGGGFVVNSGYQASDFIKVSPSTDYIASDTIVFPSWYDENLTAISGFGNNVTSFTTPSTVHYVRLSSTNSVMTTNLQLELGSVSTFYIEYGSKVLTSKIVDFNEEIKDSAIAENFKQLEVQKNLYNALTRTVGYYVNPNSGDLVVSGGLDVSDFIPILQSTNYFIVTATFLAYYRQDKSYISGASGSITTITTPSDAYFIRFSTGQALMSTTQQMELGSIGTIFEPYRLGFARANLILNPTVNIITVNRDTSSGADFVGNTALQDAIDSITDATIDNQYSLECEGIFEATQTSDYQTLGASGLNFISAKNYVNVIGKETFKIIATLPTFDNYYVPILWNAIADLENCEIIAYNNRYGMHIEGNGGENRDYIRTFRNVKIKHDSTSLGFGQSTGEELYLEDCTLEGGGKALYLHNNNLFDKPCKVSMLRTKLLGNSDNSIQLQSLGSGNKDNLIVSDCVIDNGLVNYFDAGWQKDDSQNPNHAEQILSITDLNPLAFNNSSNYDTCLKFTSKSTGGASTVLFDETSTAFDDIIGNSNLTSVFENDFFRQNKNGYSYKSGSDVLKGFAISGLDIAEVTSRPLYVRSLGKRLGDCSTVNKTLTVIVDGTTYNIVFDKNYDGQANTVVSDYTNAQIITEILAVLSAVCDVEMYSLTKDYFPAFKGVKTVSNSSASAILKGMGIVFSNYSEIRKATNSDNKIDGIALDDFNLSGKGRIITSGDIYSYNSAERFSTLEVSSTLRSFGDKLGMSSTDGVFSLNSTPTLLECNREQVLKIK